MFSTPACRAAAIDPPVRPHDLRHWQVSWLLAGGADLQVVKAQLGHRRIATTSSTYTRFPTGRDCARRPIARDRGRSPRRRSLSSA
jgi:integrase